MTLNKMDLPPASAVVDRALFRCTAITRLALRMPEGALTQLPDALGALTQLTTLILSRNALPLLPPTTPRLGRTLRVLEIAHNKLQELPAGAEGVWGEEGVWWERMEGNLGEERVWWERMEGGFELKDSAVVAVSNRQ